MQKGEKIPKRMSLIEFNDIWQCAGCRHQIYLTAGTVFDNSKLELRKWYLATF